MTAFDTTYIVFVKLKFIDINLSQYGDCQIILVDIKFSSHAVSDSKIISNTS